MSTHSMNRVMLSTVATALLTIVSDGSAIAQTKDKDPTTNGVWIADVERPAAARSKSLKGKGRTREGLEGEGRMENLRTQRNMDLYQKALTARSSIAKKQDEAKKGMVKKIK